MDEKIFVDFHCICLNRSFAKRTYNFRKRRSAHVGACDCPRPNLWPAATYLFISEVDPTLVVNIGAWWSKLAISIGLAMSSMSTVIGLQIPEATLEGLESILERNGLNMVGLILASLPFLMLGIER